MSALRQAWYFLVKSVSWLLLKLAFRLEVSGQEHIPRQGPFLLASNHFSHMDPVVLGVACPKRLRFIARSSLFSVPILGWLISSLDTVSIRREGADVMAMREAIRRLRAGQALAIFPEGTRQRGGTFGTVKPGFGLIVELSEVVVIPVVIQGTYEALPPGARFPRLAKIRVAFGPRITYIKNPVSSDSLPETANVLEEGTKKPAHGKAGRDKSINNRRYDQLAEDLSLQWRRLSNQLSVS